jgi:hypothetical protein
MSLSLGAIVLHVPNIESSAPFWSQALGYDARPDNPAFLGPKDSPGTRLHLDETDRTHLDLWVDHRTSDLETEVARLVGLGATRAEWTYPPNADFVVLAAPDRTLFCVIE